MSRLPLIGRYTAADLHLALKVCLARWDLRRLRAQAARRGASFDVRPDGRRVSL